MLDTTHRPPAGAATVTSQNATIESMAQFNPSTVTSVPPTFSPSAGLAYTATGVNGTARISLYFPGGFNAAYKLKGSDQVCRILPLPNECEGVSNPVISGAKLSYDFQDNGPFDGDETIGSIFNPTIVGTSASAAASADTGSTAGGGGGACFIATAAYGSYLHPYVKTLRIFRDTVLLASRPGSSFVNWYYRVSPPVVEAIAGSAALSAGFRVLLLPALGMAWLSLTAGTIPAIFMLFILLALIATAARTARKRF